MVIKDQIFNWFRERKRLFKQVGKESILPYVVGLIWGGVACFYNGKDLFDSYSLGGAAFFFAFSLQSAVLRTDKNIKDADARKAALDTRDDVISIRTGVEQLIAQGAAQVPQIQNAPDFVDLLGDDALHSARFFDEAQRALAQQLTYSAVLAAAVGFEQALRRFGHVFLDVPPRTPLFRIVTQIGDSMWGRQQVETLRTLLRLRNGIVHGDDASQNVSKEEAETIVSAFLNAIAELQRTSGLISFDRKVKRANL